MSSKWKILKDDGPPSEKDNPFGCVWNYYIVEYPDGSVHPMAYFFSTNKWVFVSSWIDAAADFIVAWRRLPTREDDSE